MRVRLHRVVGDQEGVPGEEARRPVGARAGQLGAGQHTGGLHRLEAHQVVPAARVGATVLVLAVDQAVLVVVFGVVAAHLAQPRAVGPLEAGRALARPLESVVEEARRVVGRAPLGPGVIALALLYAGTDGVLARRAAQSLEGQRVEVGASLRVGLARAEPVQSGFGTESAKAAL